MSGYRRTWNDSKNAAGFAAACARLVQHLCQGTDDHRQLVENAIAITEAFARGEPVTLDAVREAARDAAQDAATAHAAAIAAIFAVDTVQDAVRAADAAYAAIQASGDGYSEMTVKVTALFEQWTTRDEGN